MPRAKSPARPADLSLIEFRHALVDNGFAWIRPSNVFVDILFPRAGRYTSPVTDKRGHTLRQATLDRLFADRELARAEKAEAAAESRRQAAIAETIAPRAAPIARATLQGPAAVAQLADDFIVAATRNEGVVKADLILMGWLPSQLGEHAEAARQLAYRRQEGVAA